MQVYETLLEFMTENLFTLVTVIVAIIAVIYSRKSARAAADSLKQSHLLKLFSSFGEANRATLQNPDLLYSVHGLDESVPKEDASRIAYLSLLLDAFQHFNGQMYGMDYSQMEKHMKAHHTFLNKILAVKENQRRWEHLKKIHYGDFDKDFVTAIDNLIKHVNAQLSDGSDV